MVYRCRGHDCVSPSPGLRRGRLAPPTGAESPGPGSDLVDILVVRLDVAAISARFWSAYSHSAQWPTTARADVAQAAADTEGRGVADHPGGRRRPPPG